MISKKALLSGIAGCLILNASHAQMKIGSSASTVDSASILELESPNKAIYMTRVSLSSTTDVLTVPNPKAGMMVYNTNGTITGTLAHPAGMYGVGVYYFDGTAWIAASCCNSLSTSWSLSGNSGTTDGVNFIGTTDAVPLSMRVNNVKSGRIESNASTGNVSYGYASQAINAPNAVTGAGDFNTSVGYNTLSLNTNGRTNSAFGYNALSANTADSNTALGFSALHANTTGINNTAAGANALLSNLSGSFNTGAGTAALRFNYAGNNNTAFGTDAGFQNNNPLLGAGTNGSNNTFIGTAADSANASGNNITALGYRAGYANKGSNNTFIGAGTSATSNNLINATAVGANASVCVSNSVALGAVDGGSFTVSSANVGINVCDPTQRIDFRNGHIRNRQDNLPTLALTTASGITTAAIISGSSDVRGTVSTTGYNNATTYTTITVTFQYACTNAPIVTLTPTNAAASTTSYYVSSTISGFAIWYRATTAQTTGAAPVFNYHVIE